MNRASDYRSLDSEFVTATTIIIICALFELILICRDYVFM